VEAGVDDAYLVRRAQEGYLDAYAELVDRYSGLAYRVALRVVGNHHDAEDVAQEALVAAWQQLPNFRAQSSFSTWLYRIVTHRALNRVQRQHPSSSLDVIGDVADACAGPAMRLERDLMKDAWPSPTRSRPCRRHSASRL
jgi:RNA polymerase sigma-70 factor (ECF subfamily)